MIKEIIVTSDGSHSISIPAMGVTYHSTHGAIQESQHVFIEAGLNYFLTRTAQPADLSVFETGFGTGLNALLTLTVAEKKQQKIYYETIEPYPLEPITFNALNYCHQLNRPDLETLFSLLHTCQWDTVVEISPCFSFKKINTTLLNYSTHQLFNLIYFDAFAPEIQPELWDDAAFGKIVGLMQHKAVLTTYCSKSVVRKAMSAAGLIVEKIPGPPHKREMVRAVKG